MGIIAKTNGLPLESHIEAVYQSAIAFNSGCDLGIDDKLLYYFAIYHDLGKANPVWLDSFQNRDIIYRHEIGSIFFIDSVPTRYQKELKFLILSHHKSVGGGEGTVYRSFNNLFGFLADPVFYETHIGNIAQWGLTVVNFLKNNYNIHCEIPTEERCKAIINETLEEFSQLKHKYSETLGVCMAGDHFGSCFADQSELRCNINKLYRHPDTGIYDTPNELYPLSLISSDRSKKHTLVEAPTGCGKTNFVMRRCQKRIFYLLPYQASINAMYKKFHDDFQSQDLTIGIRHGSRNSLNFLDADTKALSDFYGLPITVMTPFQILSICFCLKGYEAIIDDIKGQDVILDEIHTYSQLNKAAIYELIKVLKSLGCNIHIMTATMPQAMKEQIVDILGKDDIQFVELPINVLSTYNRHIIHTIPQIDIDSIVKRYENGEKVLIVRNQRHLAINTYLDVKDRISHTDDIAIIHSAMERATKAQVEDTIYRFNKRPGGCILVSTQVVEVSLDINYDCLYTDCSDICNLVQRFGRVNRQRTQLGVMKDVFVIQPYSLDRFHNNWLPYPQTVCDKTFILLQKIDGQVLQQTAIQDMINQIHSSDDVPTRTAFSPINQNGLWKYKEYCHNVETSIPKELEFAGFTGILQSKIDEYLTTNNRDIEIPISEFAGRKLAKHPQNPNICIIPNNLYNNEIGFFG